MNIYWWHHLSVADTNTRSRRNLQCQKGKKQKKSSIIECLRRHPREYEACGICRGWTHGRQPSVWLLLRALQESKAKILEASKHPSAAPRRKKMRTALPPSHQSNEVKAAYKTAMLSLITPEGCRDAPKKRKQLFRIGPKRSKEAAVVYVFTSVMTLGVLSWRFQPQAVMGDSQFRLEGEKNKERKGGTTKQGRKYDRKYTCLNTIRGHCWNTCWVVRSI